MKNLLLFLFVFLLFGCWILQFVRAKMRRRMLNNAAKLFDEKNKLKDPDSVRYILFRRFFYDIKRFRLLKKEIKNMPKHIQKSYRQYLRINFITILAIFLIILFGLLSYKV